MSIKKNLLKNIILSFEISIIFVSAIFLSEIISYKNDILVLVYIVFTSLIYGFAMKSKYKKEVLLRLGLSIPFSYITIQYFWLTHYSVRALNWAFPSYGKETSGGAFTGFVLLLMLLVLCLIAGILSCYIKVENNNRFEKIQIVVISVIVLFTAAAVLILEQQFPSYQYVIYS